jgi:hypothetical protein
VRISFAKLGLNVKAGTRFGIAFDMTTRPAMKSKDGFSGRAERSWNHPVPMNVCCSILIFSISSPGDIVPITAGNLPQAVTSAYSFIP